MNKRLAKALAIGGIASFLLVPPRESPEEIFTKMNDFAYTIHEPGHLLGEELSLRYPHSPLSRTFEYLDKTSEYFMKILAETPPQRRKFVEGLDLAVIPPYLLDPTKPFTGFPFLNPFALKAFELAREEVKEKTGIDLYIIRGFRTYREQEGLKDINPYAAPAGKSSHEEGLALDLRFVGEGISTWAGSVSGRSWKNTASRPLRTGPAPNSGISNTWVKPMLQTPFRLPRIMYLIEHGIDKCKVSIKLGI